MSTSKSSRTLPSDLSLADVLAVIQGDLGCSARQRHDRCSAVRTLAKAVGKPAAEIAASPGQLQRQIKDVSPGAIGLSRPRWRNVLSLVRKALKQAGVENSPGRHTAPLSPTWKDLYRYLNRTDWRIGLSRFAHFCSARGIDPSDVDDRVTNEYLKNLLDHAVISEPREVHRVTCVYWNQAVAAIPAWPRALVKVPSYVHTYSKPWTIFPFSLKSDADAYIKRLSGADILDDLDFRPLRPSSLKSRTYQLRQFASALVLSGYEPSSLKTLADLVGLGAFKVGLRFFLDRHGDKSTKQIHDLACTLQAVARHWVKLPPEALKEIKAVCKRLDVGRGGLTAKNTSLLRQFDDKDNVAALIHLSERLLAEAQKNAKPTLRDALPVQTALCIELLLMMPMRISNLARLDLDRHIILPKRSGGPVHISIASGEVKNDVGIEAELPAPTVRLLLIYLKTYRSLLLRAPSSWLFPGEAASHKSITGLAVQIKETIARKTGLRVNAHLFRHIAAKLYLTQNPGAYGVIRLVHGHKSVETTTRHYCGTETAAAMRHFDENVLQLRKIYRPKLPKGRSQLTDKVKRPTNIPKDPVTKPPKGSR